MERQVRPQAKLPRDDDPLGFGLRSIPEPFNDLGSTMFGIICAAQERYKGGPVEAGKQLVL